LISEPSCKGSNAWQRLQKKIQHYKFGTTNDRWGSIYYKASSIIRRKIIIMKEQDEDKKMCILKSIMDLHDFLKIKYKANEGIKKRRTTIFINQH